MPGFNQSWRPVPRAGGHKYGAIAEVVDGIRFPSRAEASRYRELQLELRAGTVERVELQPAFKFACGARYVADFRVWRTGGGVEVEDVKGVCTPVFKLKLRMMRNEFPNVQLYLVKRGKRELCR